MHSFLLTFQPNLTATLSSLHYNIDSLKKIYGINKHFSKNMNCKALLALSYYPELLNEHIRFEYSDINSTAQTTVTFGPFLKK